MARSRLPRGVAGEGRLASIRRLAARTDALRAGTALDNHGEARMALVERAAGEQMRGADRGQRHADRADRKAPVGQSDHVHRDGVRIGPARFASEALAPGFVVTPSRAVGPPCAVATGPCGVDGGAPPGEFFELGRAGSAVGDGQRAEQAGLQDEGSVRGVDGGVMCGGRAGGPALRLDGRVTRSQARLATFRRKSSR
jgi:hypothetical protein